MSSVLSPLAGEDPIELRGAAGRRIGNGQITAAWLVIVGLFALLLLF